MEPRLLHLASPLMTGADVKKLQKLLNEDGYGKGLDADGEYGPMTAQAVYRAQFWLGFPRPDQLAGRRFTDYLTGAAKPTPEMRARVAARKKAAKEASFRFFGSSKKNQPIPSTTRALIPIPLLPPRTRSPTAKPARIRCFCPTKPARAGSGARQSRIAMYQGRTMYARSA